MAWIEPKTDWVATDYFNATDYNRIKNNIAHLKELTDRLFIGLKWVTGKNLLQNTASTKTLNGVTFTVNSDGSVIANGTASDGAIFELDPAITLQSDCVLTGCPDGGSGSKYLLVAKLGSYTYISDSGDGVNLPANTYRIYIAIYSGQVCDNLTFYPMIRKTEITDDTYEPYHAVIPDATSELITIDRDKEILSLLYAREINNIETNLETINAKTYQLDIGSKVTYSANKPTPLYEEYNRIESAILRLYEMLTVHKANLPRLALTLGQKGLKV